MAARRRRAGAALAPRVRCWSRRSTAWARPPSPALVLLAFVAGSLLGLLPFTPGGLGFVEAGLAGTLALAGISTGDALVATLVYRLLTFWFPIPTGLLAAYVFRRRHPRVSPPGRRTG
ncbi:MAG: flippase-like domain-containing protein [Acidimicrobiia bacterium]